MSQPGFSALPSYELGGVIAVNAFAVISSVALVSVACRVIWLAIIQNMSPEATKPKEYVFFNTQLGYYAACLLIGNLFTDISGLIGLRWVMDKGITPGGLCTLQAVLMQLGNWAIAYFTVAIAVHTFNSLVLKIRQSVIVSAIAIFVGWASAALLAAGPFIDSTGYGVSGISCGIRPTNPKAQFFYHLFPIFAASVLSAVLYSLIFLVLRGTLNIKGGVRLTLDPNERWSSGRVTENYHRFVARIARSMLWYPIAYIALLVPYSVTRLLSISGFTVAFESTIFAYTCWFMLGVVNVALLYNTFRVLGPAFDSSSEGSSGMYEKYHSYQSKGQWASEKAYPAPPYRSPTIASFGHSASPNSSIRPLLPVHQERSASIESYYSYPSSPSIGRAITPVHELSLQRSITPPEAVAQKFSPATARSLGIHSRQGSNESLGLPAAPRRTRSPVVHQPSMEQMRVVHGTWSPFDASERNLNTPSSTSAETFGNPNSGSPRMTSELTPDYEPSSWGSRYSGQSGSSNGRPLLSAINTGFGSPGTPGSSLRPLPSPPRHSRSFSAVPTIAPVPTGRQRAVLVSRHESIGNASDFDQNRIN